MSSQPSYAFAVMLIVETRDPRLSEHALVSSFASREAGAYAKVRHAVLQHLPRDVHRLVAVMPVDKARELMTLHEAVTNEGPLPPPADYVPPTRE